MIGSPACLGAVDKPPLNDASLQHEFWYYMVKDVDVNCKSACCRTSIHYYITSCNTVLDVAAKGHVDAKGHVNAKGHVDAKGCVGAKGHVTGSVSVA